MHKSIQFICIILIVILNTINVNAQNKLLKEKSIFWEITPKGGGKPSYLYGTMHVSNKVAFRLSDKFYNAIKSSDIVALESNPEHWNEQLANAEQLKDLFALSNVGISNAINYLKPYYSYSYGLSPINNNTLKMQLAYEPVSANQLLFRSYGMQKNFEEDTYLDLYIFKTGKKFNKQIESLEDVVWSTTTVIKASYSESNRTLKKAAYFGNVNQDLEDAYRNQDLIKLDSIQRESSPSEEYINGLLYIRNDTMFSNMEKFIKQGKSIFSAVGAAHLGGDKGLLLKFLNAGYKVTPIFDASNLEPSSNINKLDSIYLPVVFKKQFTVDSTISFSTPGFVSRSFQSNNVEYLATDMTNGVYYYIGRKSTYQYLSGMNSNQIEQKFDSLLFENTKGTIITKKKGTCSGYPCIDFTNKTKEGKIQNQKIIITPLEIIFCKTEAKENYLKKYSIDSFLNSIEIKYQTKSEIDFLADVKFKMPLSVTDYPYSKISFSSPNILLQGIDSEGDYFQYVRNYSVKQLEHEEDTFHLNMYGLFIEREFKMKTVNQKNGFKLGLPYLEIEYITKENKKVFAQIISRGSNVYFLIAGTNTKQKADNYFQSFELKNDERKNVPTYIDTNQHYSLKTFSKPLGGDFAKEVFSQKNDYEQEVKRRKIHTSVFQENDLGYQLTINISELNKYEAFPTIDSFWNSLYNEYKEEKENKFIFKRKIWNENNQHKMLVSATDTNTQNISYALYINSGNKILELLTFKDSVASNYNYLDTAINSIQFTNPIPSVITLSKFDTITNHIYSKDSLTKVYLSKNYYYLNTLPQDEKKYVTFIDTSEVLKKKDDIYNNLLYKLDYFKTPTTLNFIKKLYKQNEDNSTIQVTLLNVLSSMDDTASTLLYKQLITEAPPLEFEEDDNPLNHYYDTLSLCRILFPDLIQLIDFDDYKIDVVYLLNNLLKDKKIDSSMYEQKVNYFVLKGKEEIKRRTSQKSTIQEESEKDEEDNTDDDAKNDFSDMLSTMATNLTFQDEKENWNSSVNFSEFYAIKTFASLLKPYKNKDNVKEFFLKMDSSSNKDLRFFMAMRNVEDKLPFDKNIILEYAALPKYKYKIIHDFYFSEQENKIPFKINGQEELAKIRLAESLELSIKDELKLVSKEWVKSKNQSGYLYIFKYKKEKTTDYKYAYFGLFDKEGKKLLPSNSILNTNFKLNNKSESELIKVIVSQFRVAYRTYITPAQMLETEASTNKFLNMFSGLGE